MNQVPGYQPPTSDDRKKVVASKLENKPVTPQPKQQVVPTDQFENLNIEIQHAKAIESQSVPEVSDQKTPAPAGDVKQQREDAQPVAQDVKAENVASEQGEAQPKGKSRRRKKNKNQDSSNQALDSKPVQELQFELATPYKKKKQEEAVKFEKPSAYQQAKDTSKS